MKFKEVEKMISDDGWKLKTIRGSHHHYIHPKKLGKVTIPMKKSDLDKGTIKSIKKQAGLL